MVDLVTISIKFVQKKYLILAWENLTNELEGRVLQTKTTKRICQFIIEEIIFWYGCSRKITIDRGKLDANEVEEFFRRICIRFALIITYNLERNGKSEYVYSPIVKTLIKACKG